MACSREQFNTRRTTVKHKLITTLAAPAAIIIADFLARKAEATAVTGVCDLSTLTRSYSPIEKVGLRLRRACMRVSPPLWLLGVFRRVL